MILKIEINEQDDEKKYGERHKFELQLDAKNEEVFYELCRNAIKIATGSKE